MIVLSILAVIVMIACASVTALVWIMIGSEVEERKGRGGERRMTGSKKERASGEAQSNHYLKYKGKETKCL